MGTCGRFETLGLMAGKRIVFDRADVQRIPDHTDDEHPHGSKQTTAYKACCELHKV